MLKGNFSRFRFSRSIALFTAAASVFSFVPASSPAQEETAIPSYGYVSEDELLEVEVQGDLDRIYGREEPVVFDEAGQAELEQAWERGTELVQTDYPPPTDYSAPAGARPAADVSSTGALSILNQAPRVRFEEPIPSEERRARIGIIRNTPAGPGEVYAPPGAGQPVQLLPTPRPTPRPTPTPTPTPKPGILKRSIRAIPFLGPRLTGGDANKVSRRERERERDEEETAQEGPGAEPVVEPEPAAPVLYPPPAEGAGASLTPGSFPPPVAGGPAVAPPHNAAHGDDVVESAVPMRDPAGRPAEHASFQGKSPAAADDHALTFGTADAAFTTAPAMLASAAPYSVIQATAPVASLLPPQPVATAAATVTSPTLESTDLNFPNPAVEENESLREKYSAGVLAGRAGNHAEAARLFREYATNHALSRLAPRALFLASILEPDPVKAAEDARLLEERFPENKYVEELKRRRPAPAAPAAVSEIPAPADIPVLEQMLATNTAGPREPRVRIQLGQAYIQSATFDRAMEVLLPALDLIPGQPEEAEILILISDAAIATGDYEQATRALSELARRHPGSQQLPRVRLNQGLLYEEAGAYQRARSMYHALLQEAPASPEAELARQRLRDLRML